MASAFDAFINRLDVYEKSLSELENMTTETSKIEKRRDK